MRIGRSQKLNPGVPVAGTSDIARRYLPMYAIFIRNIRSGGVLRTLSARVQSLREIAPGASAVCFYVHAREELYDYPGLEYVSVREFFPFMSHLSIPWKISQWIETGNFMISHLILRTHFPTPFFLPAFIGRTYCLITEHHFLETELKSYGRISGWVLAKMVRIFRPSADAVTDGKIALTSEILRSESFGKPSVVIGNGSNNKGIVGVPYKEFGGKNLHILTVLARDFPWNGLERMIKTVGLWVASEPNLRVTLSIAGDLINRPGLDHARLSIKYLGYLSIDEIRSVAADTHLAFSTLGLWRQGLNEACSLKSRLYIDLGTPYIAGYRDPDIDSSSAFLLEVANDDSLIPWSVAENFLGGLSDRRLEVEQSLDATRKQISPENKALQLHTFLKKIHV